MVAGLTRAAIAACIIAFVNASPALDPPFNFGHSSLFEKVNVPVGWAAKGSPQSGATMKMQIGLKQKDMDGLHNKLMDISNPDSANYGKWLSKEEMEAFTSPSKLSVDVVKAWLKAHGIADGAIKQPTPDWIEVSLPISKAEGMLNSKYSLFKDDKTGQSMYRTHEYSIPLLLHDHVDTIQPTTSFHTNMGPRIASNDTDAKVTRRQGGCDPDNIVPSCIQSYYNVDYTGHGKASLGVTGFIGYSASHEDAANFLNTYDSAARGHDFTDGSIGGARNDNGNPTLEGNLDTQIALSIGYPNPVTYYAVGPNDNPDQEFGDELVNFGNYLNSASNPPSSVSTSYGGEENGFSSSYLDRICNEFMKAGSRGVSVFFSSGDFGVGGNGESNCNQGFYALFPASCPYITSVGATQFANGGEIAATFERGGSTGGGFSYHWSAPTYQAADTKKYVSTLDSSYDGYYNPQGRGYPDISLVGRYYDIVLNGKTERVYGTSASSPAWAALISLINDSRKSSGKSSLGFLNPLLYGNSAARAALIDITSGNNQGCGENGFYASKGWDPTTGLGSMNFAKLRAALS